MASLATTDKCPYCLQNINQGQSQYGPICNNGHRAHLNCIMKQFEYTGSFNIDTWMCPLCRAPAFYDPDPNSETPSLNQVLRDRFPRRIAKLEEREEDLGSGRISIDELSQQYPFLSSEYRENEQDYVMAIMTVLSINVRMNGVFPNTSQFQDTEDAENMGNILLTQWFEMYNMATAYEDEDEGDMEDFHSTLSNQSPFFRALTVAILLGYANGFWNLDLEHVGLLNDARRRAAEADGIQIVNLSQRGGNRKKKGGKRKTRKKRGGAVTEFLVKNDQASINAFFNEIRRRQINGSYVEHSPSDELGLEHLEEMMMESLLTGEYVEGIYGVTYAPNRNEGPYGRFFADYFNDMDSLTERLEIVSENNRFPNDVTQLQSAVEEQIILPHPGGESPNTVMDVDDLSGGRKRRRKKKTRKKRGGNIEEVNRQLRLLVDQVLQNHTRIQELEQWQEAFEDMELEERIMTLERQRSGTGGTGGGKRKKKTRKKRGGMDELPTPPQVPRDNDVGTKQYEPGQLGVQQPPQIPPFVLPPPANTEPVVRNRRAAIRMERAPPNMIRSADERAMLANRANDIYTRSQRSHLRNFTGDLMERCTGSRCGLGGRRRKKKTRKKKNKKRRTKKKSRRRR